MPTIPVIAAPMAVFIIVGGIMCTPASAVAAPLLTTARTALAADLACANRVAHPVASPSCSVLVPIAAAKVSAAVARGACAAMECAKAM